MSLLLLFERAPVATAVRPAIIQSEYLPPAQLSPGSARSFVGVVPVPFVRPPLPVLATAAEAPRLELLMQGYAQGLVGVVPVPIVKPPLPTLATVLETPRMELLVPGYSQAFVGVVPVPIVKPTLSLIAVASESPRPELLMPGGASVFVLLPPTPVLPSPWPGVIARTEPVALYQLMDGMGVVYQSAPNRTPVPRQPLLFASVTLTVVDSGSGLATATITGSSPQSTNTISTAPADANIPTPSWTTQGARTGDGSVVFTLAPGMYWGRCLSTLTNPAQAIFAPLIMFGIAPTPSDTLEQCIAAVKARLQGMLFAGTLASPAGIDPTNGIVDGITPIDQFLTFPALMISVEGESEGLAGGTNLRDDFRFPVRLTFIDQNDMVTMGQQAQRRAKYTKWREQVYRAFSRQRLGGVPQIFDTVVSAGTIVDTKLPTQKYFVSGVTVRFADRMGRGLST